MLLNLALLFVIFFSQNLKVSNLILFLLTQVINLGLVLFLSSDVIWHFRSDLLTGLLSCVELLIKLLALAIETIENILDF